MNLLLFIILKKKKIRSIYKYILNRLGIYKFDEAAV